MTTTAPGSRPRVVLLIRALSRGGAQRQLVVLAKALQERADVHVVTFYTTCDGFESELAAARIQVHTLGKRGRWDLVGLWRHLSSRLDEIDPEVVYSFLPVPNIVASAACLFRRRVRVVWGVRAANMNLAEYGWLPRVVFSVSALAARTADAIIVNSAAGRDYHVSRGYPAAAVVVIPNGIDTDMFKPDLDGRARVRSALRIPESDVVVGLVGRLDPVKDHELFLRASALLHREHANLRVICAGGGPRSYQSELESLASTLGLHERAIWLDAVPDVPGLYNALDLLCSSSRSEGFSNVIGEAMATGIACAVTATGDSEAIVGEIGVVTRSHDPESLAAAMAEALRRRSKSLAAEARKRVMENYSVAAMTSRTHAVLFDFTKTGLPGRRFHASI